MKNNKLVPMIEFVLDIDTSFGDYREIYLYISRYADFLSQYLTLGQFIPCVDGEPFNYSMHGNKAELETAKERVLFQGFEILPSSSEGILYIASENATISYLINPNKFYIGNTQIQTVEDFITNTLWAGHSILTPNALKILWRIRNKL